MNNCEMSVNQHVMMSSDQCSSLCHPDNLLNDQHSTAMGNTHRDITAVCLSVSKYLFLTYSPKTSTKQDQTDIISILK